ncbi:MAG: type I glutamate--ammonia ligase, partial [Betaproteobacteria bacterium]|nr:type I glutamate--ammonia ligase [Betaproteobacteria bacterium]
MNTKKTNLVALAKKEKVKWVDLRFTDLAAKMHHVTLPVHKFTDSLIKQGKPFDGSSIPGWKGIEDSDMVLMPDAATAFVDPFYAEPTLVVLCDIYNPDGTSYNRCPRGVSQRAESFLKKSRVADAAYFGPELEFFVFDAVRWKSEMGMSMYEIISGESAWGTDDEVDAIGHRPGVKGGYFPVPPVDSLQDLRSEMCSVCAQVGIEPEVHHHEVATAGQCEIGTRMGTATTRGDHSQIYKYIVRNVAHQAGKTATFMPKPIHGDNGNGMHVHQSLVKGGRNLMAGNKYAGLSETALYYIGGILKHAKALNAFCNPTTNSYKRLIPGFEAPTILAYSARNRSVSIRIPHVADTKQRRIEVRFPDPTANGYLAFAAMMLAGIDGIKNKITPGKPKDMDMYSLSEIEAAKLKQVSSTLTEALFALDQDRKFLTDS